ncbi:hypothetical protein BASA83_012686 [Batrachochytrium salamandrivorans]|nr:hypothetical protein BASA83_012686 [Batrachochytrium salamandrivorans]
MRVVALISGGKDSCFNMMHCVSNGHTIVALANLHPPSTANSDELDSYMFQTVGHDVITHYAECMELPLFRQDLAHGSVDTNATYTFNANDEVEDLYKLLSSVMRSVPNIEAVSTGAILSNYQRTRIESVCVRLGIQSLSFMWQGNQEQLLTDMIDSGVEAVLVKVAAAGLSEKHLGKTLAHMQPILKTLNKRYGINVCGEGGEYETLTLDCPLFKKRLRLQEKLVHMHAYDDVAPVAYLKLSKMVVETKTFSEKENHLDWIEKMQRRIRERHEVQDEQLLRAMTAAYLLQRTKDGQDKGSIVSGINQEDLQSVQAAEQSKPQIYFRWPFFALSGVTIINSAGDLARDDLTLEDEMIQISQYIIALLAKHDLLPRHITQMHINVADMKQFSALNRVYQTYFGHANPATRITIESSLDRCQVQMDCFAVADTNLDVNRDTLHVQGISYWAPANIGPYSQAVQIFDHVYLAGQIGLLPHTMKLPQVSGDDSMGDIFLAEALVQASVSLRNLDAVCKSMGSSLHRCCVAGVCYLTDSRLMDAARVAWDLMCMDDDDDVKKTPLTIVVVGSLPRGALVEWEALVGYPSGLEWLKQSAVDNDASESGYGYISATRCTTGNTYKCTLGTTVSVASLKSYGQFAAMIGTAGYTKPIGVLECNVLAGLVRALVGSINQTLSSLDLKNGVSPWTCVFAVRVFHLAIIPASWVKEAVYATISTLLDHECPVPNMPAITLVAVSGISDNQLLSAVVYASFLSISSSNSQLSQMMSTKIESMKINT